MREPLVIVLVLAGLLALAGCGGSGGGKPAAVARSYELEPGGGRGFLIIRNTTSRQIACLVDGFGDFDVPAGSHLSIRASDAQSIADMFLQGVVTDWVECGGDANRPGFPGAKRLDGLGLDPFVPNVTLVYTGDRFFRA